MRQSTHSFLRALGVVLLLAGGILSPSARAQDDTKDTRTVPPEVLALFDDIDDIDKLRVLAPLKLSPEQAAQIASAVAAEQVSYRKRLDTTMRPAVLKIAPEVTEARTKMLTGGTPSPELAAQIKTLQAQYAKAIVTEEAASRKNLTAKFRAILTPEQVKKAVSLAKEVAEIEKDVKPDEAEEQFLQFYVNGTFIVFPRAAALLDALAKKPEKAASSTAGASGTGTTAQTNGTLDKTYAEMDDIEKLRLLNPLKLTPAQLNTTLTSLKKREADYNSRLQAAIVPSIRDMAKEIKETRRKMLDGAAIPTDFDAKVKKIQSNFDEKQKQIDFDTLKGLSDEIRAALTPTQIDAAVTITRKIFKREDKAKDKNEDEKYFNLYVLGTFIAYPRMSTLLQDMRKAATAL